MSLLVAVLSGPSVRTGLRLPEGLRVAVTAQPVPLSGSRSRRSKGEPDAQSILVWSASRAGLGGEGPGELGAWAEGPGASARCSRVFSSWMRELTNFWAFSPKVTIRMLQVFTHLHVSRKTSWTALGRLPPADLAWAVMG